MKHELIINHVIVTPIEPKDGHIGYATILINEALFLTSIAVYRKRSGGFRLLYPESKKMGITYFRPISKDVSRLIETAIFRECELVFDGRSNDDRHDKTGNEAE